MDECKKTVWNVLNSIVININVDKRADCADRKYFEILNEGRKQNDIAKIYEFIDAAERGGMNPRCSSEIITFLKKLIEKIRSDYVDLLPIKIVYMIIGYF